MMSEYQHWLLTEEAHIATLTLNRPEAMNSLTAETLYELRDITARFGWSLSKAGATTFQLAWRST
jgi:enoyl-CoA hydratase/carnithine racemase